MKKILLFALPLLAMCFASCEKEWTDDSPIIQFKDPKFLEELLSEMMDNDGHSVFVDKNADGQISEKEASIIEFLSLEGKGIRNLEEIKYFTALKELYCGGNQFTSLDLSKNHKLQSFYPFGFIAHGNDGMPEFSGKCPLESLILYKNHSISEENMNYINLAYPDLKITYAE